MLNPQTTSSKHARRKPVMDIPYGSDPAQQLDFYPGAGSPPHKLVVFLHGGGFVTGNRRGGRILSGPLTQAGYALACVGYRLMPATNLAGCVSDAASATAYLLARTADFQIAPDTCAIMGHSAGGHMAALLATDQTYLQAAGIDASRLGAIVALDGIFDLASFLDGNKRLLSRDIYGDDPAEWDKYSPIQYVGTMTGNPRFCLVYENTGPRFIQQTKIFEKALIKGEKTVVSVEVPGLKHAELMLLFKNPGQPMLRSVLANLSEGLQPTPGY